MTALQFSRGPTARFAERRGEDGRVWRDPMDRGVAPPSVVAPARLPSTIVDEESSPR